MDGVTVRLTSPSRSRLRRVSVSMRCETLGISRLSSLNRFDSLPRLKTTSRVHLSPIRASNVLILRHTELLVSFIVPLRSQRYFLLQIYELTIKTAPTAVYY